MLPGDIAIQTFCVGKHLKIFLVPVQTLSVLLIKNNAMKAYGERRHQTEMSGQLHALAAISPGEEALVLGPENGGSKHLHNITNYQYVDIIFKSRSTKCYYLVYVT